MAPRNLALVGVLIAVFAVVALCAVPASARKKKIDHSYTCTCTCTSDKKGQGGLPVLWETQSYSGTDEDGAIDCELATGFGGCRIKVGPNKYEKGTLQNCNFSTGVTNPGNAGADPTGGNGPTQPFSRPGIILLPRP